MMRRRTTTTVAVLASLALAAPAIATPSADSGNTLIQHGFDPATAQVLFTVLDAEEAGAAGDYQCEVPGEDAVATTDTPTDEEIATAVPVSDDGTADDDSGSEDEAPKDGDSEHGDSQDGDDDFRCELTAVDATGPNGQVNHGQVVSAVVHALKDMGYRGIGCIVRVFARSDYGRVSDDDKESRHAEDFDGGLGDISVAPGEDDTGDPGDEFVSEVDLEETFTDCPATFHDRDDRDEKPRYDDEDDDKDSKDRGPKDKGPKDKGPKDKDSKDRGPKDKDFGDRGPKDKGPKDKDSKDHGPKDKAFGDRGPKDNGPKDRGPKHKDSWDEDDRGKGSNNSGAKPGNNGRGGRGGR